MQHQPELPLPAHRNPRQHFPSLTRRNRSTNASTRRWSIDTRAPSAPTAGRPCARSVSTCSAIATSAASAVMISSAIPSIVGMDRTARASYASNRRRRAASASTRTTARSTRARHARGDSPPTARSRPPPTRGPAPRAPRHRANTPWPRPAPEPGSGPAGPPPTRPTSRATPPSRNRRARSISRPAGPSATPSTACSSPTTEDWISSPGAAGLRPSPVSTAHASYTTSSANSATHRNRRASAAARPTDSERIRLAHATARGDPPAPVAPVPSARNASLPIAKC